MKKSLIFSALIFTLLIVAGCKYLNKRNNDSAYVITKKSGRIILEYKVFGDFLKTDRSWDTYEKMVLKAYPEMQAVHDVTLGWGSIDSVQFPKDLKNYKVEDWKNLTSRYNEKDIDHLYDSVIGRATQILKPLNNKPVDMVLFLPYPGCFMRQVGDRNVICISLEIDPRDVKKLIAHEFSHNLHFQRRPEERLTLKREVVSEGMAVYLTTLILDNPDVSKAIPFMPEENVKWCFDHEQVIKDSIKTDLNDSTNMLFIKYIADGSFAKPPVGFVEKTGYFAGYRIIKACIDKGIKLEDVCSMNSDEVIEKSGYFNE